MAKTIALRLVNLRKFNTIKIFNQIDSLPHQNIESAPYI